MNDPEYTKQVERLKELVEATPNEDLLPMFLAMHDVYFSLLAGYAEKSGKATKVEYLNNLLAHFVAITLREGMIADGKRIAERN